MGRVSPKGEHGAVPGNPMVIGSKLPACSVVVELVPPTASTGQGGDLARRRYQKGQILFSKSRQLWLGRYREDTIRPDGSVIRARPQIVLGTKKELPTQRLAARKLDEILSRINDCNQLASQRWPNLRPAGARKSSPSENRQRCAPPTRISTLKFFRSWESSA